MYKFGGGGQLAQAPVITCLACTDVQEIAGSLSELSREELTELVRYHIVPRRVTGTQLHNDRRLMTLSSNSDKRLLVKRYHSVGVFLVTPSLLTMQSSVECGSLI